jgi:ABC-type branched-subunit amino acid transport system substrate-binding protein
VAGSAGPGTAVGVTDSTITLSADGSFSGPYGAIYEQEYKAGPLTWRDEVNAHGGINGRKIAFLKVDDQYTEEGAVAACKAIRTNGSFVAFTQTLPDNGLACLNDAGIPSHQDQVNSPNPEHLGWTYVRSVFAADGEGATLARYVAGGQGLNRAGHKIGLIYTSDHQQTSSPAGSFMREASRLGLSVTAEKIATNQATFTAELERLRQAGVDTVAMICAFESAGILRDAKALAYNPVWTGMFFNADEVSAGGAALYEGIKAPRDWPGADSAAFQRYRRTVAQYNETVAPTTTNFTSYGALLVMQRALELAGHDLTREKFLAAYNQIQNFDPGGAAPVTFRPGQIIGTNAAFPLQCCASDNTWKSIGPSADNF